ncbi:MAG: crossover junction endodeoxyribonuclease RuvC [Cytophagales bacterium]|nr:crossover junction endodeoxyribonuclease RuvC [Cytophagales bacterium]MDW8384001.1 crossover junction endodeoxyribonuclease RuvC [Flammeovirgaceae bacterium]
MKNNTVEKIILGIDPGTRITGYGIIRISQQKPELLQYGVIHLEKYTNYLIRLQKLLERILQIITDYQPHEMAIESPFYGENVQSMLKLGRAQGVVMSVAFMQNIPIVEYAPKKIKQTITGNGNASKEQVSKMITQAFQFQIEKNTLLDATDALAVALCHFYAKGISKRQSKSWENFVSENPDRIL